MEKESKTARELEALILNESQGMHIHHLEVRPEPCFGWGAYVIAAPQVVGEYQAHVDRVARELQARYDLKQTR